MPRSGTVAGRRSPRAHILTSAADGVTATIEQIGGDVDRVFGTAGIDLEALANPLNKVDLRCYCNLLDQAARQTGYRDFGLLFGQPFVPHRLGAIGYLTISAPTMNAAINVLCEQFPAHQGNTVLETRSHDGEFALVYEVQDDAVDRRQDAEFSLMVFRNMFRHALGPAWAPVRVGFSHPDPGQPDEHEQAFDAPVVFGEHTNYLLFRASDLQALMPTADAQLHRIMMQLLRRADGPEGPLEALRTRSPDDFVDTVREHVVLQMELGPSLEQTAKALFMSSTTLYRRLRDHGIHFNDLVRTTRCELTMELLRDHTLSLTDISVRLGYSELSAFSRAFRQWTGMSAAQYRRNL